MRIKETLTIFTLAMLLMFCSCGAAFATNTPKLNIDKRPVYAKCSIDEVIKEANRDYKSISSKYENVDIIDVGIVKSIEKNQKSMRVTFRTYEVTVNTDQKAEVARLAKGSNVTVYGKLKFESDKKKIVSVTADHIIKENVDLAFDYYIYGRKTGYKEKDSTSISLDGGRIEFMIPNDWVYTEAEAYDKIFNSKIYSSKTGKCYYINRALGGEEPEVFCAFYFDNNLFLERSGDSKKTKDIEKEIINNICPQEEKVWKVVFPTESSTSSKGIEFSHYVANHDNYRVEFAFTPVKGKNINDNGGICVMMHMYINDSIVPDDVLYVMSSLKVLK